MAALAKKIRLSRKKDIEGVFLKGKTVTGSFLFIKYLKNKLDTHRITTTIPSKTFSKTAERNKIRRRIDEAVHVLWPEIKSGYDILIIAKPNIKDRKFKEIEGSLKEIFKKANLMK